MVAPNTFNRVAAFLPPAKRELPPLPTTPEGRQAAMADVLFAALFTLQSLMTDPDAKVAFGAATAALDFEKTRLRHGRDVAGTAVPPGDRTAVETGDETDIAATDETRANDAAEAEFDEYVREAMADIQDEEDARGNGVIVTWERAAKLAAKRLRAATKAERRAAMAEAGEAPPAEAAKPAPKPAPVVEPEPERVPELRDLLVEDDNLVHAWRAMTTHTCESCGSWTVARERMLNVAVGRRAAPKCMGCLAAGFDLQADELMYHVLEGMRRRPHFWQAWQVAVQKDVDSPNGD